MLSVEKAAERAADLEARAEYVARLVGALEDPSAWQYTGTVVDHGPGAARANDPPRCVCGHPVRWHFEVTLTRDLERRKMPATEWVGSVCVAQIAALAPELAAAIGRAAEEAERKWRQAQAEARRAKAEAERSEAEARWRAAKDRALAEWDRYRATGRRAPYQLWLAVASRHYCLPAEPPAYRRTADYIRWYRTQAERWEAALAARD